MYCFTKLTDKCRSPSFGMYTVRIPIFPGEGGGALPIMTTWEAPPKWGSLNSDGRYIKG